VTNINDNQERYEGSFGEAVEKAVSCEEFKQFIYPLTIKDAAKLFDKSVVYLKKISSGERSFSDFGKTKQDVLSFLKTSPDAAKSRQQFRNQVSYKEYVRLMGLEKYKCVCCCYPAAQKIYSVPLCEGCVSKAKNRVIVKKKKTRSKRR
jgi:hypothetical protein